MRILIVLVLAAAAACGGGKPHTGGTAKGKKGPPTCTDAAGVLATKAGTTTKDERRQAAIAKVCVADKWPPEVVKCVLNWPQVEDCLMSLTEKQRQAYITARVNAAEPAVADTGIGDDTGGDDDAADPYAGMYAAPPIACDQSLGDVANYDPPITQSGEDRDYAIGLRRASLLELCDGDGWSDEVRKCFYDGYDVSSCRSKLDAVQDQGIVDRLAKNDELLARIGKLAVKPAAIDCKKVVAESRAAMKTACVDDNWSALMRACIVGDDTERCLTAAGFPAARFGFPAAGVAVEGVTSTASAGLYERLGGDEGVGMIVDTWVMTISSDSRISQYFANADIGMLQSHLYDQLCQLVGGPCKYSGKDMKSAHAGMKLTQADLEAFLDDLRQAIASATGAEAKDQDEVVNLFKAMSGDIVSP
jgi:hemoglobin